MTSLAMTTNPLGHLPWGARRRAEKPPPPSAANEGQADHHGQKASGALADGRPAPRTRERTIRPIADPTWLISMARTSR